jgi:antitoxin FitA
MPNLSIKDVPEHWAEVLRQRAIRHHRSLQGELLAMVEAVVLGNTPGFEQVEAAHQSRHSGRGELLGRRRGRKTIEEIATEMRAKSLKSQLGVPLSVDIIRTERDTR